MANDFQQKYPSHGGNIFREAKLLKTTVEEVIDASASLVPFPLPKKIINSLNKAINSEYIRHYPDRTYADLKEVISSYHAVDPLTIIPGNGASELFTWAAKEALINGLSMIPSPCFSDYSRSLKCWNASYIEFPLPLSWSKNKLQDLDLDLATEASVIWITNPHNPTGQLWSKDSIERFLIEGKLVICDEAFLPLVNNGEKQSMIPLTINYPNLIVIRSLTKLFSLAGLRIGYAISSAERINRWERWRDPWPVNGLAVIAGISILNDSINIKEWISKIQKWVQEEGEWMNTELKKINYITPLPSSANFLLIKSEYSLLTLQKKMTESKILLRDCRSFPRLGNKFLRISYQTRKDNERIIENINKLSKYIA